MKDFGFHLLLFLLSSVPIVVLSAMFASRSDREVLAGFPRRYLVFVLGCSAVAVVMLVLEHTLAWSG